MIKFNIDFIEMFLGVVRKYMQIRGGLSQKDLAEAVDAGISTMSRFLNQKTKEIDEQMIAKIVAYLNIPLHEVIDFVDEESTHTFKKLVAFYKDQFSADKPEEGESEETTRTTTKANIRGVSMSFGEKQKNLSVREKLDQLSPRQKGFLTDFLDLDPEGKDLIVDVGNSLFRYFKQRQINF
ncbi:MAG: helix-turn-helix transcriptional regulator [Bdellovibrionota bacterium]|nr:helix-turn-helix transcriptional regulator [Bdellovibrionota bacterium]